jgi:LmbE family N-acetylglucosaminyl deacetylase
MGAKRLLVALAHPDDETFICGGGLAAFARAGGEAHLVCATRGEHGRRLGKPPCATRESLPVLREAELRTACAALGIAHLVLLGLRDKCLEFEELDALAARVAEHIRRVRPDGVLTFHERRGGHTDHNTIGRAATLAWERAGDPAWHPEQLGNGIAAYQAPRLYWLAGRDVAEHPDRHGTVAEAFTWADCGPAARQMLAAHRAHRTQTQLDAGLWEDDERVAARFAARREVFQQANAPFTPGERGLLGLQA